MSANLILTYSSPTFTSEKPEDRPPGNSGDHRSKEQHHTKTIELEESTVMYLLVRIEVSDASGGLLLWSKWWDGLVIGWQPDWKDAPVEDTTSDGSMYVMYVFLTS